MRLYLHGFMGTHADWAQIKRPGETTFDYGSREWPAEIDHILDQIEHRKTKPLIVGYSMGARLGLSLALHAPDRFAGLVMISGHPGLPVADRAERLARDLALADQIESDYEGFLATWYDQPVFEGLSPRLRKQLETEKLGRDPAEVATQLRHFTIGRQANHWTDLETVDLPVLAIAGEEDTKYSLIAVQIQEVVPQGFATVISRAGHLVHRQQPKAVNRRIEAFEAMVYRNNPSSN